MENLLSLSWYDRADRILLGAAEWEGVPLRASDEEREDVERDWFASVEADGAGVCIAEGSFDDICAVRDAGNLELRDRGTVAVDGVDVRWKRAAREAYDRAWEKGVASCRAGRRYREWGSDARDHVRLRD